MKEEEERACQTCRHKFVCLDQMLKVGDTICEDDKLEQYEKEETEE